ncbi:eukaryotic ribosome biogenesis protein [Microdochium trichocladiopsis]|uniref:Ribosome biogenesis protein ERB1 n=1 Tax=Microdochium trichocladiopsis TaxID=1682393 RepID=A0A9P9BWP3_9PEZI|nr:eukaryotic ribosome biogenesis protein [Microdochium trichocladiopsis]KAH7035281.1 eukaryotic ribosome biogenesis protein [Microdochium trichocladiopsis]
MAPSKSTLKRKASTAQEDPAVLSDDEFGGVALEGVLDGESDDEDFTDNDDDDQNDSDVSGSEDYDEDEEDDLASDDVPSDGESAERKVATNGAFDDEELGPNYTVETDANGGTRYVYKEIDPVYDSDDSDANEGANTIGNIPLSFYDSYPHIGYTIDGKKIMRPAAGDALDNLLDSIEVPKGWTGLTDPQTGKPLNLSQDELELLRKLQMGEIPAEGYDPYPDTVEWFTSQIEEMPLSAAPEPKRRFLPSKHEQKRVMKLVKAIKEGRIQPYKEPKKEDEEEEEVDDDLQAYDLWADEQPQAPHIMNIPAPKLAPPGYDLSYNPPPEYLPDEEERKKWEEMDPEERDKEYLPQKYDSLRKTPAYDSFVKERFERCLDLYLAPRVRKNRLNIDPTSLLPKLPRPEELRPFPTVAAVEYVGHEGRVRSVAVDPTGEWLASGGDDGTVRVWGLRDGKQQWSVKLSSDEPVETVRWRPGQDASILAAVVAEDIFLMIPAYGNPELEQASRDILDAGFGYATNAKQLTTATGARKDPPAKWIRPGARLEDEGVLLKATVRAPIRTLQWHRRGDYFCTVSPTGQRSSVAIHTLSKHLTQIPFRKLPGLAQTAQFHPSRPLFFVATQRMVRCYDLQRQELVKVVQPGARWISSFDIHPGGDNLVVGSYDRRLLWHELELSTRPFKTMRFHTEAIRAVKFHRHFPLFADASDDGSLQIFHAKVVNDVMEDPVIVPVKMLKGHKVVKKLGILDVDWHPQHPWCVSAGADGTCRLWQ